LPLAIREGLLTTEERAAAELRLEREEGVLRAARETTISPVVANPLLSLAGERGIEEPVRIFELAKRPGVDLVGLLEVLGRDTERSVAEWAQIEIRYGGYLARESEMAGRLDELEAFELPGDLEYRVLESISFEAREKLSVRRPSTLGQASRIPGVSPSDLHSLVMEVTKRRRLPH
jgi:tRNA uridine 5-carboxymethylaminomethyl modification enzyme